MPDIPSIGQGPVGPVERPNNSTVHHRAARAAERDERGGDRVELSRHAQLLDRLRQMPEVRVELVERVRLAIGEGTYITPQKLDEAVERLLAET